MPQSEFNVFLSYPSGESSWVQTLANALERQGVSCFLDAKDVQPGHNFVLVIGEALQKSHFLVLILSKESASRPWVQQEWTAFTALNGPTERVLPVLLEPVELPALLSPVQAIQAKDRDAARVARIIRGRVRRESIGKQEAIFGTECYRAFADQLSRSQTSRFHSILRYAFANIDRIPIGDALALSADEQGRTENSYRVPVSKLIELHRASILCGEPGAGKSTSLQQATHRHAEAYLAGATLLLPVYVDLKWWSSAGLRKLINSTILDLCPEIDTATLEHIIERAPLHYYLDSFDEAQDCQQLLREIREFVSENRKSRVLVASRQNDLLASLGYPVYELALLNRSQIREILDLYLAPHSNASDIDSIYHCIEQYGLFAELGNPMMLWFFSLAIRGVGSMEKTEFLAKGKIFSRVVENYFLSTWEPKAIRPWVSKSRRYASIKVDLLSRMARKMIEDNDKMVVTEEWVLQEFVHNLVESYSNSSELAQDLLDQILCHNLLEKKGEYLAFWHKSLRNFFAARSLARDREVLPLSSFAREARWHEPIVMLASLDERFIDVIEDLASIKPALGLDCVSYSELSREPNTVRIVVQAALRDFFSDKPLEERVHLIQRLAILYKRVPVLVSELTYDFLFSGQHADLCKAYESMQSAAPVLSRVAKQVRVRLDQNGIVADIETRVKPRASFIRKASNRGTVNVDDMFGVRLITESLRDCYAALGTVYQLWHQVPGRFRDYIAMPRFDLYRALHTTVAAGEICVEIIIQTAEMQENALATWPAYRDAKYGDVFELLEERQASAGLPRVPVKTHMYGEHTIAVFTPRSDVVLLTEDSTILDFAHRIHSEIFVHSVEGIVNGKRVHIGYPLKNLDRVQVITDQKARPDARWLPFVRSDSARRALLRHLRYLERRDALSEGRTAVDAFVEDVAKKTRESPGVVIQRIMRRLGCQKLDELCRGVARGKYDLERLGNDSRITGVRRDHCRHGRPAHSAPRRHRSRSLDPSRR